MDLDEQRSDFLLKRDGGFTLEDEEPFEQKNADTFAEKGASVSSQELLTMEEAMERWLGAFYFECSAELLGAKFIESVPLSEARGRICASPVVALRSVPSVFSSAVNGLALSSKKLLSASYEQPCNFTLGDDCALVSVGDSLPEGCDVVLLLSEVTFSGDSVLVNHVVEPWKNVRPIGEEVEKGSILVPAGVKICPSDISVMLVGGATCVEVYRRPRISIINISQHERHATCGGNIVNGTSTVISGFLAEEGAEAHCFYLQLNNNLETVESEFKRIVKESDGIILISDPEECLREAVNILNTLGQQLAKNIAVNPGRNIILYKILEKPLVAVPYFPASAYAALALFMRPLIRLMLGGAEEPSILEWAKLADKIKSHPQIKDFTFVKLALVNNQRVAVPNSGNVLLRRFASADGYVLSPTGEECLEEGSNVLVKRLTPMRPIERNIVIMGSQDVCFSLLDKHCLSRRPAVSLIWKTLTSHDSFEHLLNGYCHAAAIHIFDPESGVYNIPFVEKYCQNKKIILFGLYRRSLGFVVAPDNPLDITTLSDLTRPEVRFVNRQTGSGTRQLFDWKLASERINPQEINGYDHCLRNHLESAAEVAAGRADVGLSIPAAAKAMGLTFVPYWPECLDLAVPIESLAIPAMRDFIEILRSPSFRKESSEVLPFYDFSCSGEILWSNVPEET